MDDRERIRQRFNRGFASWEIVLPVDAMSPGVVWFIVQRGWTIWTRFDIGAEDGREYLDYYAMHRMTGESHVRLHADGEREYLPAMGGATPFRRAPPRWRRKRRWTNILRTTKRSRGCWKRRALS